MRILCVAVLCAAVGGCAAAPKQVWVRLDGQDVRNNPVLLQQADVDRTVCMGETQKASLSGVTFAGGGLSGAIAQADRNNAAGQVGAGCMAGRGYTLTVEDQRDAKLAELAAVADMKRQQEQAAARPAVAAATKRR